MAIDSRLIWEKIKRAMKHIEELNKSRDAFIDSQPYRIEREHNPQTREFIYRLVHIRRPMPEMAVIAGEALYDLRSALDHLAWWLVENHIGTPPNPRDVYFPICESSSHYGSARVRLLTLMDANAVGIIDAVKPYKGGNDILWRLNKLNNIDKHRLLLTVASIHVGYSESALEREKTREEWATKNPGQPFPWPDNVRSFIEPPGPRRPLKEGDILLTRPDSEISESPEFIVDVALHEPPIVDCEFLIQTIHQMKEAAGRVLLDFDISPA
jgi:hypothetical protein